ncbi:MAG: MFS transporter [Patescibacteria group bacterium]
MSSKLVNKIIKVLIANNVVLNLGWGLVLPVFAIFILQDVALNDIAKTAKIIGLAELFFAFTRIIFQIPIGRYLDKNHGEKDDFWFMIIGNFMQAFIPLGFIFSTLPWHIYALQMLHGLAAAMAFPSWSAMFTRHIDKNKEGFEWSIQSTFANLAVGLAAAVGGFGAAIFGPKFIFIFVSIFTFISGLLLIFIRNDISATDGKVIRIPIQVRR